MSKLEDKYEFKFISHNSKGKVDSVGLYNNSDEEGVIINILPKEEIVVVTKEEVIELEIRNCPHRINDSPSRQLCSQMVTYELNETLYGFCNPKGSDCIFYKKELGIKNGNSN